VRLYVCVCLMSYVCLINQRPTHPTIHLYASVCCNMMDSPKGLISGPPISLARNPHTHSHIYREIDRFACMFGGFVHRCCY